jgi:outer membrane protein assembly factor BamB
VKTLRQIFFVLLSAFSTLAASEWNEWRGPERNGIINQSPALLDSWPATGPKLLWKSEEKIPGNEAGGFGSVSVAGGNVYCYCAPSRTEPLTTRTLDDKSLAALGWSAKKLPAELLEKVEKARVSTDRQALKDAKEIQAWIKTWLDSNLTAETKQFGDVATDRLNRGVAAIDFAILEKLESIKNKEFASQGDLDKWLDENSIKDEPRKVIVAKFPTSLTTRDNVVLCIHAADGKTVWKKTFRGAPGTFGASCTPCIADNRCYVLGMGGKTYCLDAKTGDQIWEGAVESKEPYSSFIVEDGVAIATGKHLTGFDALKGTVLWTSTLFGATNSSAARWKKDGKTYVIARGGGKLGCIEPHSGKVLWSIPDSTDSAASGSSPAVDGDRMAVSSGTLNLYKLSLEKAESYAQVQCPMDYSAGPTIVEGHAYLWGRKGTSCVSMETGKLLWTNTSLVACAYCSSVFADGKMFIQGNDAKGGYGDGSLSMFKVSPEKGELIGNFNPKQVLCTTPAISDGLLYLRLGDGIACYELKK